MKAKLHGAEVFKVYRRGGGGEGRTRRRYRYNSTTPETPRGDRLLLRRRRRGTGGGRREEAGCHDAALLNLGFGVTFFRYKVTGGMLCVCVLYDLSHTRPDRCEHSRKITKKLF